MELVLVRIDHGAKRRPWSNERRSTEVMMHERCTSSYNSYGSIIY
jgi:hypothetical protein